MAKLIIKKWYNLYDTPLQNFTSLKMIFKGLLIQNNGNVIAIFINTFLYYYWTDFVSSAKSRNANLKFFRENDNNTSTYVLIIIYVQLHIH